MTIYIREVAFAGKEYQALLPIRYEILRKPLGLELSDTDIAGDDKEFHIAAFDHANAIGCVLLRPISTDTIKLRQMAVIAAYQGRGIGAKLVGCAEELAKARGFATIEMHARKFAQGFYEKLGYVSKGKAFIEVTVPTIKMVKPLH
jgi:GNAT superfamily N-acetyltransferase